MRLMIIKILCRQEESSRFCIIRTKHHIQEQPVFGRLFGLNMYRKYYPDAQNSKLIIRALVGGEGTFTAKAYYQGKEVGCDTAISNGENADLVIKLSEKHLWEVGNGRLYDLKLQFEDDIVDSYFGLRSTYVDGYRYMLNGKSVFQRTVLDQGYYKEGIYTAPSEEDMIND